MWRWVWNASDPRIPRSRPLPDQYISARYDGHSWNTDDLSPEFGRQTGRFRIFVEEAAFGPRTNALRQPPAQGPLPRCRSGTRIAAVSNDLPYICLMDDGSLEYFIENNFMGSSRRQTLVQAVAGNKIVDRIDSSTGRVEVLKVLNTTFVANFYDPDSTLRYSLAFRTEP